jgi:hypothetical protein
VSHLFSFLLMSHSHQYQPQPAPETTLMPTPTHSHHQRAVKLTIRHPSHTLKRLFLAPWRSFTKTRLLSLYLRRMFNFSTLTFFVFTAFSMLSVSFIGRKFHNAKVQSNIKHFPFKVGLLHQRRCGYHPRVLRRISTAGSQVCLTAFAQGIEQNLTELIA